MKKQRLIVVALVVCATIVLVAVAITRHVNNKQDAAWCYDHGYATMPPKMGSASEQGENSQKWAACSSLKLAFLALFGDQPAELRRGACEYRAA